MPTSVHDWVELWFGHMARTGGGAAPVEPLLRFNHALPEPWKDGDVDVLVVENQGVWLWGRSSAGKFVERENEPGTQWQPTGENEEEFWLHHAAFEALWSMPATRSALLLDPSSVSRLKDASAPLPCREWSWPGERAQMRHRNDSLAMICRYESGFWVLVAGRTEEDLLWLDPLELEWDESDSRNP